MHRCLQLCGVSGWSTGISVLSDAVTQVIRPRRTKEGGAQITPVRSVVAKRSIPLGERLCVVPESHILHGENADNILRHATNQGVFVHYIELKRRLASISGVPHLLCTRDSLLITLALLALRHGGLSHPLAKWVSSFPPRVPPAGLFLLEQEGNASSFTPIERRLRVGDQTVLASPSSDDSSTQRVAAVELMLRAAECYGIKNVSKPRTEIVPTEALMTAFYKGRKQLLTKRQHEAHLAKCRHSFSAAQQQLLQLETSMYCDVLSALQACISAQGATLTPRVAQVNRPTDDDAGVDAEAIERLRWSHFMMRSRAVNLHFRRQHHHSRAQSPKVAVVPFLDMLNHSARSPSVTYYYRPGVGVIVVASRLIKPDEELTLNYGNYCQRGCLFHEQSCTNGPDAIDGSAAMRLIESRQLHEWDSAAVSGLEADHPEDAPFGHGPERLQQTADKSGVDTCTECEEETRMEAVWLWRFGFARSEEEKAYLASRMWSKGLRRRVAQLTDIRRRGRPGEFVMGVPEGLQYLREQRERLERERFGGTAVFPPQSV